MLVHVAAAMVEAVDVVATDIVRQHTLITEVISLAGYHYSLGNLQKLEEAANMFKTCPGAISKDGPLTNLLKYGAGEATAGNLGTARGAAYELEKAYDLARAGEEVIEFGRKIGGRQFDIETPIKLIECKNIDWSKKVGDLAKRMQSTFAQQQQIAQAAGKTFEVHSKATVPANWRKWFERKGIILIEG